MTIGCDQLLGISEMDLSSPEKQLPSLLSLRVDPPTDVESSENVEVVLPQVLEEVLALKDQRAMELGTEELREREDQKNEADNSAPVWEKKGPSVIIVYSSRIIA